MDPHGPKFSIQTRNPFLGPKIIFYQSGWFHSVQRPKNDSAKFHEIRSTLKIWHRKSQSAAGGDRAATVALPGEWMALKCVQVNLRNWSRARCTSGALVLSLFWISVRVPPPLALRRANVLFKLFKCNSFLTRFWEHDQHTSVTTFPCIHCLL